MLNKIKVIGKFLIKKEQFENKIDDADLASQGGISEIDKDKSFSKSEAEGEDKRESWFRFSLMVWAPSGSKTPLRCITVGEVAERIKREVGQEEVIEVWGYLRNERVGQQIVIRVVEFNKLDVDFEEIDKSSSNQARLLGKIITDVRSPKSNSEILSFRLAVPREGVKSPLFFCRVNEKKLIPEVNERLKRGDIILLEGFLQTLGIEEKTEAGEKKVSWISSIICYGFTFLDSDSVNVFSPLDNLTRVVEKVSLIDFSKPRSKVSTDEQME